MIKFFRNIRQRMIRENRFSRYLIYAIGEIILVVIGILIALTINEWNNERNRKQWEDETISQLKTDLLESQKEIVDIKQFYIERAQASATILRTFWVDNQPFSVDSLNRLLSAPMRSLVYSPPLGTAKALINSGKIDLLENRDLKTAIITHVEKIDYLLKDIARYEETYYRKGVELMKSELPNTILSLDHLKRENELLIKARNTSERAKARYALGLYTIPDTIDRVPFKTDIKSLFNNQNLYSAYYNLFISHRNRYFRYEDIYDSTDELLKLIEQKN